MYIERDEFTYLYIYILYIHRAYKYLVKHTYVFKIYELTIRTDHSKLLLETDFHASHSKRPFEKRSFKMICREERPVRAHHAAHLSGGLCAACGHECHVGPPYN